MQNLILASTSRYRAEALTRLGLTFASVAPNVDEQAPVQEPPAQLALRLAHAKAAAVARQNPDAIVIGSDQVGDCNGQRLAKPGSIEAAVAQLQKLSGQAATFYTAVAVHCIRQDVELGGVVNTDLQFRAFSPSEAATYVHLDQPLDCAGSFKVESLGITLFERVSADDPTALVGLPIITLLDMLATCGVKPLQQA